MLLDEPSKWSIWDQCFALKRDVGQRISILGPQPLFDAAAIVAISARQENGIRHDFLGNRANEFRGNISGIRWCNGGHRRR
jgi:hypothetical protein